MMIRRARVIFLVLMVAVLSAGSALYWVFYGPNNFVGRREKALYVSKGQTFASVVDSLEAAGIIRSRVQFVFVARVLGGTKHVSVGKYVFLSGISNVVLLRSLREGRGLAVIPVTIREGLRSQAQARVFARAVGLDSARFVDLVHDESFIHSLGIDARSLEGYLLPETYILPWQPDERDVIGRQVDQFKIVFDDSLRARAKQLRWTTHQALTMASIIEGEAVLGEERPVISGVYHNRLRKRMYLEADPTIQFIIDDGPRRVRYSDLRKDSPYNTYRNFGLPPGPVNNPGKASIVAALYPARHNYLYFVANGSGGHWFTTNYADHLRQVRKYRKNRAQSQGTSVSRVHSPG